MAEPLETEPVTDKQARLAGSLFLGLVSIPIANWLFDWSLFGRYDNAAIGLSFWLGYFLLLSPALQQAEGLKALPRMYAPLQWYVICGLPVLILLLVSERPQRYMQEAYWLLLFWMPVFAAQAIGYLARRFGRH